MVPQREAGRQRAIVDRAAALLLAGRRLFIDAPGHPIYLGRSAVERPDPYWYEHKGGRTHKALAVEAVRAVLPHVGYARIENAVVLQGHTGDVLAPEDPAVRAREVKAAQALYLRGRAEAYRESARQALAQDLIALAEARVKFARQCEAEAERLETP